MGAFSGVAAQVLHDPDVEISCHHLGQGTMELDKDQDAWIINPDKELEVAANVAIACGIMSDDESSRKQLKEWCDLGGPDFQGPR